ARYRQRAHHGRIGDISVVHLVLPFLGVGQTIETDFESEVRNIRLLQNHANDPSDVTVPDDDDIMDRLAQGLERQVGLGRFCESLGQRVSHVDQHGRHNKGERDHDKANRIALILQKAATVRAGKNDIGDLVKRRQKKTDHERVAEPQAKSQSQADDKDDLDQKQYRQIVQQLTSEGDDFIEIDRHADGNEEQSEQHSLERRYRSLDLIGEYAGGKKHPDHKGAQCIRQAD